MDCGCDFDPLLTCIVCVGEDGQGEGAEVSSQDEEEPPSTAEEEEEEGETSMEAQPEEGEQQQGMYTRQNLLFQIKPDFQKFQSFLFIIKNYVCITTILLQK